MIFPGKRIFGRELKDDQLNRRNVHSISRRDFLGTAGSAAAAVAFPSALSATAEQLRTSGSANNGPIGDRLKRTDFHNVFAPAGNLVKSCEKPFRESICLNGAWQFQPVPLPEGFQQDAGHAPDLSLPEDSRWESQPLFVPSPWNVNSFADRHGEGGDFRTFPSYPASWEQVEMGWLRKTFTVPAQWKDKIVSIEFEAVAGDAIVIVNGKKLASHFDLFLPFSVDVTDAVVPGRTNEVLVGVRKASLFDDRGKYGRRPYQGGSFWGQHIAGIWQDVFLLARDPVHISDVYIVPNVDADELEAQITVSNRTANEIEIALGGEAFPWLTAASRKLRFAAEPSSSLGKEAALKFPAIRVYVPAHGSALVALKTQVGQRLKHWTPDAPYLYGLITTIHSNQRIMDVKYTRFGWRQFAFRGSEVQLNGERLILRGDSWHFMGIPQMTRRYAWAWFTALREAGLNAVRLHAQPYPAFYLDVADEMGILVLDETAVWASDAGPKLDDPAFWNDTERHLTELILRDRNHSSVFGWSVCNEMRPIVRSVLRNPPGLMDILLRHYEIWAGICKKNDPTRPWISADGDEDGEGRLPVFVVHYGGRGDMERAVASGKPWGVGETGNAYYATPEQVAQTNGERAYVSCEGRMEGVAVESYQCLMDERTYDASYRSVFNLVWYGLRPLPLGLRDTSRAPLLADGIFFSANVDGRPGVQPQRLGPYCSTLNPGYDPNLPLLRPWPLFDAIRDASAEPPVAGKWSKAPATLELPKFPAPPPVLSASVAGAENSELAAQLHNMGVPLNQLATQPIPQVLFIDGIHPPGAESRKLMESVWRHEGTVLVWGADRGSIARLNALLPAPLSVVDRVATSLLPGVASPITAGLEPSNLYFCDQRPPEFTHVALAGPLIARSAVLVKDCDTDWMKWNGQPEYAKTAMVLRSELEAKPSGTVLAEMTMGKGRLLMTTLPSTPAGIKQEKAIRRILANLGFQLQAGMDSGKPLLRTGALVRVLACGYLPLGSDDLAEKPWQQNAILRDDRVGSGHWQEIFSESGNFNLSSLDLHGSPDHAEVYLSFWVSSPRSLVDLLVEPDMPQVDLHIAHRGAMQIWLNDEPRVPSAGSGGAATYAGLKLRESWNHFLVRIGHTEGAWQFEAHFTARPSGFVAQLDSALERA